MARTEKIILLGGGGHAKVLIEMINASGQYKIVGLLDSGIECGNKVSGIPVLGSDDLLEELYDRGIQNACIAIGSVKDNSKRKLLFNRVKGKGFHVPFLIHPAAIVSESARLSEGAQVMVGAIVQSGACIGENTIINTGAIVEHDCLIGSHVHICPGAVVSGGCTLGDGAFIGAGATVIQGIRIGDNALITAGAVVIKDVPDGATVKGVPAR